MTDTRVAQVAREVLDTSNTPLRVAGVNREALLYRQDTTQMRVGQVAREAVLVANPATRILVGQVARETLRTYDEPRVLLGHTIIVETPLQDQPDVFLRWSDTRGASWSNAIPQTLGAQGEYETDISWRRLGMSRDRVYELSWSAQSMTALTSAFVIVDMLGT